MTGGNSVATRCTPFAGHASPSLACLPKSEWELPPQTGQVGPKPNPARYWILWRNDDAQMRTALRMPAASENRFPHQGLCTGGFESPGELMADLVSKGWRKDALDHQPNRIALVETTSSGIRVNAFPTYATAVRADAAFKKSPPTPPVRPKIDTKLSDSEGPQLKPCPFCKKADRLSLINWTHERPDGTEYIGEAVKCDRCDAIAPLAVFQSREDCAQ